MSSPVLLAPAGSQEALSAALKNGADAVYFGAGKRNMRASAAVNFTPDDIARVAEQCHEAGAEAWLALNTTLYDEELSEVETLCLVAEKAGVDAVIAADPAAVLRARDHGLSVHMSVQSNVCNMDSIRFWAKYADAMVLARELRLEQVQEICRRVREENVTGPSGKQVAIEVFAHGALCMAVSGRCYLSLGLDDHSANRGECYQPCRRAYKVTDLKNGRELELQNPYIFSPNDLCTINILDRLIAAGVSIFKIEGRGRGADYVAAVTSVYREAIDAGSNVSEEQKEEWITRLKRVFNRGFWDGGYYLGLPSDGACSGENQATEQKVFVGQITNWFNKHNAAQCKVQAEPLHEGDTVIVTGATTGAERFIVTGLRADGEPSEIAEKGSDATFVSPVRLRENDKVYIVR